MKRLFFFVIIDFLSEKNSKCVLSVEKSEKKVTRFDRMEWIAPFLHFFSIFLKKIEKKVERTKILQKNWKKKIFFRKRSKKKIF